MRRWTIVCPECLHRSVIHVIFSVIDRDLNGAGRGLNIVVLDTQTNEVLRIAHFDTYAEGWCVIGMIFAKSSFL